MMADHKGNTAASTYGYPLWYVGCTYPKGQQVLTEQEDGLTYLVATAHANGDDYRKNARMIAAAPQALRLLERLTGFASHYTHESAIRAGGDLMIAEAEKILREVRGT